MYLRVLTDSSYCKQGFGVNRGLQNRGMSPLLWWRMGMGELGVGPVQGCHACQMLSI